MYSIDTSTAATHLPIPASAGEPGYFISASPALGRGATSVSPDWLNAVQDELLGVIAAAGTQPDKRNRAQLGSAISMAFRQILIRGGLTGRRPKAGEIIAIPMLAGDLIPAGMEGSLFRLTTPPAQDWALTIMAKGTAVGHVLVSAGQRTGQFTLAADVLFGAPGLLSLVCPAVQDATARGIAFLLLAKTV